MDAHPCSKKPGAWAARAAAALALTLIALTLSAGTAAAGQAEATTADASTAVTGLSAGTADAPWDPSPHTPREALAALCAEWEAFSAGLPFPVEPPPVCKLVNGWD
ncbi:hypothetical protein M5362_09525 [Streptomyces sp. Je 1-79]|uniref:hypothetical protein n=1 Tax=Streptomyces sp. Je 1-79 TaxID=2943847 RepID=UPI0021A88F47|nr:hypothetical protein [Streptomyces sp. Je 1-79]MCT4353366.1 hypothetical protein [Streptomyces sp. Je 1-79]